MCTVTIIPKGENDFVLTSNRDEAPDRLPLVPDFYTIDNVKLLFPKDEKGGTWIGVSENKRVVCVLNGAFVKHKRQSNYRKSRGVIANDFMIALDIVKAVEAYNLIDIEPFTIVIADWNLGLRFYELIWDGECKHFTQLPLESKIWSSSTLYNANMRDERQKWFEDFEAVNKLNANTLLDFHKNKDVGNMDYGVIMDRGFVKTTSVTQIEKVEENLTMKYENIENNTVTSKIFNLQEIVNG